MTIASVQEEVTREVARQFELKAEGRFKHSIGDAEMTPAQKLAVLTEEVGEVARAALEREGLVNDKHDSDLRTELIQVAACAVAWVACMDRMAKRAAAEAAEEFGLCVICGDSTRHVWSSIFSDGGVRMCMLCQAGGSR